MKQRFEDMMRNDDVDATNATNNLRATKLAIW